MMELGERLECDPARVAVVLPGSGYTAEMPLLYYLARLLPVRDWTVQLVRWRPPGEADTTEWVRDQATRLLAQERDRGASRLLVVGKSLGSFAAPVAAAEQAAGIWLTPLLSAKADPGGTVVAALTGYPAPALLVGGTADPSWDPEQAKATALPVLELDGADHSLELSGDPFGSLELLHHVLARVDTFLTDLDRPAG